MARKETINKQMILEAAFTMARQEGIEQITARKLAEKAGCSTQPIFRTYENMDELLNDVYEKAAEYFQDYYSLYPKLNKTPFLDLGMAYISLARDEKQLFRMLFVPQEKKKGLYELLNGKSENVKAQIQAAAMSGCHDPGALFMKMWIFIHGAASMSLTGDYDLSDQETREMLEAVYYSFS